jgi:hypothetical protein
LSECHSLVGRGDCPQYQDAMSTRGSDFDERRLG